AHGGACVAHAPDGRVVFVRHALPGERVRAVVTRHRKRLLWADAVQVLTASPDRVTPPCPWAGPGLCGGCDLQHAAPAAGRSWKAAVVREQLQRLAGLDVPVEVLALPEVPGAEGPGLGWRTRVTYAVDAGGRAGLRAHQSHEVIAIDRCRIAHPGVQELDVPGRTWRGSESVEVVVDGRGRTRLTRYRGRGRPVLEGPAALVEHAAGHDFRVSGFWQVHPAAADALAGAVLELLAPQPGERALDLYSGVGVFAAALADAGASVIAVESGHRAAQDAVFNTAALGVEVWEGDVAEALAADQRAELGPIQLVVLDPPRAGAGRAVVESLVALAPRAVAYVACDPAALARDVATFAAHGWQLAALRAYDAFPMTHHVECVALLQP
ncbi:MAG TPA: TRAM domain-containing protein, partial [Mycobacteriales bacterium]|nr:TRAM domain-containing protein [Mycobacteriales bacterium]